MNEILLKTSTISDYELFILQGTGDWILQDDCMSLPRLATLFKESDIENHIKQNQGGTFTIATFGDGDWNDACVAKTSFGKILKVKVNPESKMADTSGVAQFSEFLAHHVKPRPVKDLLQSSDVVGNIRFSRPTLYIFPGAQGDSALFGISGFNLLVNGGYGRKACFWDFTRHLDRIDAMLYTHLGPDNLFGLSSVLERKAHENVHPEIGYIYMNAVGGAKHSPNGDSQPENGGSHKAPGLTVNLVEEGSRMVENLRHLGQIPHPCLGNLTGQTIQPINLYHKVGHGTLDMFVLNPFTDSKDLKDFFSQWNKHVSSFSSTKGGIPMPHACSVCALLVWRPASPAEKITRILFPGSAPQSKVFEGLDKLKTVDIFQHPVCSEKSLSAPKVKKAGVGKPSAGKAAPTAKITPTPRAEVKKAAPATKSAAPAKTTAAPKGAKEATNSRKAAAAAVKSSPASSKASSKAGSKASTPKSTTPAETPKDIASPAAEHPAPVNGLPPEEPKPEPLAEEEPLVQVEEPAAEVAAAKEPEPPVEPPSLVSLEEPPKQEPEMDATTPEMPVAPPSDPMTTSFIDMDTMGDHPEESAPEGQEPVPDEQVALPVAVDDTAAMPEVDQAPAEEEAQEEEPKPQEEPPRADEDKLPSPDALPEPENKADPMTSSFMDGMDDTPVMDVKALAEAGVIEDDAAEECVAPPQPEVQLKSEPEVECKEEEVPEPEPKEAPIPDVIPDADQKKQMEDLGIFDDDAAIPDAAPAQQNNLADLGIYDDDAEKASDDIPAAPDAKNLEDLGIIDDDQPAVPQSDATPNATSESPLAEPMSLPDPEQPEGFSLEEVRTPKTPDHQDVSPEADHIPFNGESPQNLPEPEEPEPAMLDSDLPKVHMELQKSAPEPEEDLLPEHDSARDHMTSSDSARDHMTSSDSARDHMTSSDSARDHMTSSDSARDHMTSSDSARDHMTSSDSARDHMTSSEEDVAQVGEEKPETSDGETEAANSEDQSAVEEKEKTDETPKEEQKEDSIVLEELSEMSPKAEDENVVLEEEKAVVESPKEESSSSIPSALPEASHDQDDEDEDHSQKQDGAPPSLEEKEPDAAEVAEKPEEVEELPVTDDDDARAEECDGSDVSGGLTADDLAQCPEPEVPLDMPDMEHDSLLHMRSPVGESGPESLQSHTLPFEVHDGSSEGNHINPFLGLDGAGGAAEARLHSNDGDDDIPAECSMNGGYQAIDRDSIERDLLDRDSIEKDAPPPPHAAQGAAQQDLMEDIETARFDRDSMEKEQMDFDPLKSWGEPMQLPPPGTPTRRSLPASSPGGRRTTPRKDPVKGWEPQGLPAPPPPADGDKKTAAATKKDPTSARRSAGTAAKKPAATDAKKKVDLNKTAPAAPRTATARKTTTTTTTIKKTTTTKTANGIAAAKKDPTRNGPNDAITAKKPAGTAAKRPPTTGRPSTAPDKAAPKSTAGAAAKRAATATGTSRASPAPPRAAGPPAPVTPFYVDLTYVPCHGDMHYMDWDFFRRVRARYYVVSALNPGPGVFTALLDAKQTWDNPDMEVTIIPTYDNEAIRHWMALHRDQLAQLKIDVAPSANRCTIQLQDHETSCAAFRLEF